MPKTNKLVSSEDTIKSKFKNLETFRDVADLLEVPPYFLRKILIENKNSNYSSFVLKKKNGKERFINAPQEQLNNLQKRLNEVLSLNYNHHMHAHGFIKERSIVTNAAPHLKAKHVLNFDLENFFESISFARIRAMFMSYFKFNKIVSTTLANLCCHPDGFLPQGGATSPIISNIISFKMDKEFKTLARKYHCVYTRYADDITFSTKKNTFSTSLATFQDSSITPPKIEISSEINSIVKKNGFQINPTKTRLRNNKQHLEVTGITINEKLNVNRTYIRRIRSILHCIEMNITDISKAEVIFEAKYVYRQLKGNKKPNMFNILRGMISHVGNVKGVDDHIYLKLGRRYNSIVIKHNKPLLRILIPKEELLELNTFVIESDRHFYEGDGGYFDTEQGTSFLLRGIGLVTNYHVLKNYAETLEFSSIPVDSYPLKIARSRYSGEKKYAKLIASDKSKDIAILEIKDLDIQKNGLSYTENIVKDQDIEVIGYPDYSPRMELSIKQGKVVGERFSPVDREQRYEISAQIFGGNSGGPVIDSRSYQVVALAVRGANGKDTVPNEVIPISTVLEFAKLHNLIQNDNGIDSN